jgi:hypothetical protein
MKKMEEAQEFYEKTIRTVGFAARTDWGSAEQIVNLAYSEKLVLAVCAAKHRLLSQLR